MANKFQKSLYEVINKTKYIGAKIPTCRSSWERNMCMFFDHHPSILQWSSEPFAISYLDPLTQKKKSYWPDFLVIYQDANGIKWGEIVEVKPASQTGQMKTKSAVNKAQIIKNHAKWGAAIKYAEQNGLKFRILTENEIFGKK